jgi:hypothetical protein
MGSAIRSSDLPQIGALKSSDLRRHCLSMARSEMKTAARTVAYLAYRFNLRGGLLIAGL